MVWCGVGGQCGFGGNHIRPGLCCDVAVGEEDQEWVDRGGGGRLRGAEKGLSCVTVILDDSWCAPLP